MMLLETSWIRHIIYDFVASMLNVCTRITFNIELLDLYNRLEAALLSNFRWLIDFITYLSRAVSASANRITHKLWIDFYAI